MTMSNIATAARDVLLLTRHDALVGPSTRDVSTPGRLLELHFSLYPAHEAALPASSWEAFARLALEVDARELVDALSPSSPAPDDAGPGSPEPVGLPLFDFAGRVAPAGAAPSNR
jgi:hypothetical protein